MATTVYALNEEERRLLQRLFAEHRSRPATSPRPFPIADDDIAPEMHVAIAPAGGIGGRVGTRPGSAICPIYRGVYAADETNVDLMELEVPAKRIYNVSISGIPAGAFLLVARDKWGQWYVSQYFEDADDEQGTGTGTPGPGTPGPPDITSTGTGTSPEEGGPGYGDYPVGCSPVSIEEVDIRCESATVNQGTSSGTDAIAGITYLNLYRRTVLINTNTVTGCLDKIALPWSFVRVIGCCETDCARPDTGTGEADIAENCCTGASLYETPGYRLYGPIVHGCGACSISGSLRQMTPPNGLVWTNSAGGSTCGGRVYLSLTLYCSGTEWRAKGSIRRYLPAGTSTNQDFDIGLTLTGLSTLEGTITGSGCSPDPTLLISYPCYSYDCTDGTCGEVPGPDGTYGTIEECEAGCGEEPGTIDTDCCSNLLPSTLTVTVSSKTGSCSCLPDSFTIAWDGTKWTTTIPGCSSADFNLQCTGMSACGNLRISSTGFVFGGVGPDGGCSCDPLSLVYTGVSLSGACTGSATFTITE